MVQKSGQKVMTTMGKCHLKSCLTFACAPIPCEKKSCGIGCQLITPTILMLSRKGNMILKVDRQGFLMVPISGQKVMIITVECHLKHCLTFAHAPCTCTSGT